jgi:AcrR family transcriptional regulator
MRRKPEGRLTEIAEAAIAVFTRSGYRLTQLSDVARLCRVSAGTLYGYVANKEALLHLAVAHAVGALESGVQLPYRVDDPAETLALIKAAARQRARWPLLKAALARSTVDDVVAETRGIASELFHLVRQERRFVWMIERCLDDLASIADFYNRSVRGRYRTDFANHVRRRSESGQFAALDHPEPASRAIIELIAWLGMHRLRDPTAAQIPEDIAEQTAETLVLRALLPSRPSSEAAGPRQ